MNAFDKIIGYSAVKKELRQISDTLKNSEVYENLGVSAPRGLLLHGKPGVGKSLMASAVIEASGRRTFTCRKDRPDGDFINEIKATFERAAENAPSIVFLDDMDKFANGDERYPNAEEFVTVQSCIDEVKDKEVFVLATANNIRCLPDSLKRAGRFDRKIYVITPRGKDAEKIIAHYLKDKKFVEGADARDIARILDGRSCAELETVLNEAGLYAGYDRDEAITMEHVTEACLRTIFNVPASDEYDYDDEFAEERIRSLSDPNNLMSQIIYHEAGHAVVSEVLCSESVTLVSAYYRGDAHGGFTAYYNDRSRLPLYWNMSRIVTSLGGAAAVEQKFGVCDAGSSHDIDDAFIETRALVVTDCMYGLHLHSNNAYEESQQIIAEQESVISAEVGKFYRKAKEIIACNRDFFEKVACALAGKRLLSSADIRQIRSECEIVPVTL